MAPLSSFEIGATVIDVGHRQRLRFDDESLYLRLVNRMAAGTIVRVSVKEEKESRPNWLNRFYWGFVVAITAECCGYTKDEMHEAWKLKFLRLEDADHPLPTVRSTSSLDEDEMRRYIQDIRMFAAQELNCQVPEINEHLEMAS